MGWISLIIGALPTILKLIFMIMDRVKKLPRAQQAVYKERVRQLKKRHKGDKKALEQELEKVLDAACTDVKNCKL